LKRKEYPARKILPFFSMVNASKRLHRETMDSIGRKEGNFLVTTVPNSTEVEHMGLARKPLIAYNPSSKAGMAFTALGMELEIRGCL
jgi:chromosome partitioning protein